MFNCSNIPGYIFETIIGKSYRENPNISYNDLRYLELMYYDFNGSIKNGKMIANKLIASDILDIFQKLYESKYQINSINLVEKYWHNDALTTGKISIQRNNSSCFNYRIIDGTDKLSYHALGLAVDINPLNSITHDDLAYKLFTEHDFEFVGECGSDIYSPNYQYFEKPIISNKVLRK